MLWELGGKTLDSVTNFEMHLIKLMFKLYMVVLKVITSICYRVLTSATTTHMVHLYPIKESVLEQNPSV